MRLQRRRPSPIVLAAMTVALAGADGGAPVCAQASIKDGDKSSLLSGWDIGGSNTARVDYIRVTGDESSSPFFKEGFEPFDEMFLVFSKQVSPYERWRGNFSALYNESAYRSTDDGLVVERFNLTYEKGDVALPHRIEVGDYFGYTSFRTLQRSLKGGQVELQPLGGIGGERHSFLLSSGFVDQNYRSIDLGADQFTAGSWFVEHENVGRFAFNAVHNYREADQAGGRPDRNQTVLGLAGERGFTIAGQRLTIESEVARFAGDYDLGAVTREGRSDMGYFGQMSGRSDLPLTYSMRFEHYAEDFRPNGAVITPNRRSWEARGGWRFDRGLRLTGRAQDFVDGLEGATAIDTRTYGVALVGPLGLDAWPQLSGRFDAFTQDRESRDKTTDTDTNAVRLDLSAPVGGGWVGRLGLDARSVDNRAAGIDTITRQLNLAGDRRLGLFNLAGLVSPGLVFRRISGGTSDSLDVGPSLGVILSDDQRTLSASYNYLSQNRRAGGAVDLVTHATAVAFTQRLGSHSFGVEFDYQQRAPEPGGDTHSYRAGLFWRVDFSAPGRVPAPGEPGAPAPGEVPFALTAIAPGLSLNAAQEELGFSGIRGGVNLPGAVVYEARLLDELDQRQRLVVVHDRGRVSRSAIIIELEDVGNRDSVVQTFERVRAALIRRYGTPIRTIEEGVFSDELERDVNDGRFIRIAEWDAADRPLRLGIPRRLDRQVRIEIQFGRSFPPPRQTLWSIEEVR